MRQKVLGTKFWIQKWHDWPKVLKDSVWLLCGQRLLGPKGGSKKSRSSHGPLALHRDMTMGLCLHGAQSSLSVECFVARHQDTHQYHLKRFGTTFAAWGLTIQWNILYAYTKNAQNTGAVIEGGTAPAGPHTSSFTLKFQLGMVTPSKTAIKYNKTFWERDHVHITLMSTCYNYSILLLVVVY
jgi:hypothetical protein